MKNYFLPVAIASVMAFASQSAQAYEAEHLDRGAVAYGAGRGGMMLSWRSFITDDPNLTFDIYRNGTKIKTVTDATSYLDLNGKTTNTYEIKAMLDGEELESFQPMAWSSAKKLTLSRPDGGVTPSGEEYSYSPNDCSVGDVDCDGQYELFVKWDPSNAHDNSHNGYTGNVFIDCYRLDGTFLWRIDLGKNIRAGAHYTQFMVYDFDGDGKAEMICKTGPGSKDGSGTYVNAYATDPEIKAADPEKDWRNSNGRINGGQEWLTVFGGDGKAVHTVYYNPNRNASYGGEQEGTFNWGTNGKNDTGSYGNRGERYLACVAHLNGRNERPSAVMCRGYYTYAFLWAVDFDGKELSTKWFHASRNETSYSVTDSEGNEKTYTPGAATSGAGSRTAFGNGNHNISVADVDGDGSDEIIWGSCAFNNDGTLLYSTGYGHGDAIHVGKMIPNREGLQVYEVHEASPYGWDLHDAATGEIIYSNTATGDTGRGCAADLDPDTEGWEMWCASSRQPRSAVTGKVITGSAQPSMNFRVYWNGDLQDELLDGNTITKWSNGQMTSLISLSGSSCNGTKATPCLSADILGDWREEVILYDPTTCADIYIHSTTTQTQYKVPCLMQDPQYRMAICWQNVAYNQPPHIGYYLPGAAAVDAIQDVVADNEKMISVYSAISGIKVNEGKEDGGDTTANLSSGVYIVKQGSSTKKQLVR